MPLRSLPVCQKKSRRVLRLVGLSFSSLAALLNACSPADGPELSGMASSTALLSAEGNQCSIRPDLQLPDELNLFLDTPFPCGARVKIVDPRGEPAVAGAVGSLNAAMQQIGPGMPNVAMHHSSPDYTVSIVYSGGNGPWSGQVRNASDSARKRDDTPVYISLNGSCTASCGELGDVMLNELTQLYGMYDGDNSKWDTFQTAGVTWS